jgi:hypothetical protein
MAYCVSTIRKTGTQCTNKSTYFEHHCGIHHKSLLAKDAAYKARYDAFYALQEEERITRQVQSEARLIAIREEQAAAAAARIEEVRAIKQAKVDRLTANAHNLAPMSIIRTATRLMTLWTDNTMPTFNCPKAYAALCYKTSTHPGFPNLIRAVIHITMLGSGNHPLYDRYRDVPVAERDAAHLALSDALAVYEEIDHMALIPTNDRNRQMVTDRIRADEEAARVVAEAARQAAFQAQLREAPVIFRRDPEGSIDLRAFAADGQSVHRSSVQDYAQRTCIALIERPVPEDQDTLGEIIDNMNNVTMVRWARAGNKEAIIILLTTDYFEAEAFGLRYRDVMDRVWAFIRSHKERAQLLVRLTQEVNDGVGMCTNGKMARLVNVLQGYDESLDAPPPPREVFQGRISALMSMPLAGRVAEARSLFAEFNIPAEEHDVWLEPLLEDAS